MRHAESEAQFMRYAYNIGLALNAFPNAIQVTPLDISVETYAARFRDAVKAKLKHGYKSGYISEDLFARHATALKTHMGDGFVLLGTRDGIKRYLAKSVGEVLTADNKPELELTKLEYLEPTCAALSARAFSPAPTIIVKIFLVDSGVIHQLEQRYDVSFLPIPNRPSYYRLT